MSLKKDHAGKGGAGKNRAGRMKLTDRLHRPAPRTENVSIDTYDACVDFPIFDARTRSLKQTFLGAAGGAIGRNSSNVVVVEALKNINLHLREGDRVGLVGHNGAGKSCLLYTSDAADDQSTV